MKKVYFIVTVFVIVVMAGIFVFSISNDDSSKLRVGAVLNGSVEDKSWTQSHYNGITKAADELGFKLSYTENVSDEACFDEIEKLIEEGNSVIICNSFGFADGVKKAAEKYPDVCFFHATGVENSNNVCTYFGRMYQIRYLCGIVAGMETQTNEIGYVAAFPISEVNRSINAFTLGVKEVNPEANVYVRWTNTWTDDKLTGEATEKLINEHDIDVLAMHSDSVVPLEIADKNNVKIIGYNLDNSELYPDNYLTAAVWNWDNFYIPHIRDCMQNKFDGVNYWDGVSTGLVGLSPFTDNVKQETRDKVQQYFDKMMTGTSDVFYGPLYDCEGNLKIAEDENMSDYSLLNEFDWYVEGVVIDED